MIDVMFNFIEFCDDYFSGRFTVCDLTLVDVLDDDDALPVLTAADVDEDIANALGLGLIGSVLEAPGIDLNMGQLRRDAYSNSDPEPRHLHWYLLPQWVYFVDLPVSINGKHVQLNFQVRCRVEHVRRHHHCDLPSVASDYPSIVTIGDGVAGNQNLLSYYSRDILSAHHFKLLCEATSKLEESVWDLLLKGCSNEAEQHELSNGQALLQWFQNRSGAILGADKAGK